MKKIAAAFVAFTLSTIAFAFPSSSGYHSLKKFHWEQLRVDERISITSPSIRQHAVCTSRTAQSKSSRCRQFFCCRHNYWVEAFSRDCHCNNTLGKGFITDAESSNVVVFDTKSLKIANQLKTYPDSSAMIYDPDSKLIFTFNGDSENASVIDPATERVVKTIDMGGDPEEPVADGKGTIYD